MDGLQQAVAAALAGITTRRLQQLQHESDPPPRNPDGTYPPREFGDWLRRRAVADIHVGDDGTVYNYEAERARLTHEQADKTALENAELRGDLVRSSMVGPYWAEMVASMRGKLISLPSKLSALIGDVVARAKLLSQSEALVYEALAEIERDGLPIAVRERIARAARTAGAESGATAPETDR